MQEILDFVSDSGSGRGNITVNTKIYSIEAIHAATYEFTAKYHVLIVPKSDDTVTVIFEAKGETVEVSRDLKEFANSIIDHQLRIQLDKSNGKIRDLIVAHAFSPLDLNKEVESV